MLKVKPVKTLKQVFELRAIRNECREFMTRDQSYIGIFRQIKWFFNHQGNYYLFYLGNNPIGYGSSNLGILSGGLKKQFRGIGFGKEIFNFLAGINIGNDCWLEVFKSNKVALKLYQSLGFKKEYEKNGIITMRRKWKK